MRQVLPPKGLKEEVWKQESKRGAYRFWCVNCNQSFPEGHKHLNGCHDPLCRKHHPESYLSCLDRDACKSCTNILCPDNENVLLSTSHEEAEQE